MRGARRGFLWAAGAVLAVDVALLVGFDPQSDRAAELWMGVNFPSIPFLLCCAGPPPMGEAEITGWDYWAVAVSVAGSCASWRAVGAGLGRLIAGPGGDPSPRPADPHSPYAR